MKTPTWDRAVLDAHSLVARAQKCCAYQFWDGFDNYNASTELWDSVNGAVLYSSAYARFPAPAGLLGQAMKCTPSTACYKGKTLRSSQATFVFGFAIYIPAVNNGGLMQFKDGGVTQSILGLTNSGQFNITRGLSTLQATSAPAVISTGWHWLDILVTINSTTGSIAVYVDQPAGGFVAFNATGLNLQTSGNNWMNAILLGDLNGSFGGLQIDDFHCHDTTGAAPNAILGDSRIYTKNPNGAGYSTLWTPNGAAANWQCSDDSIPDGDTTYNSSNTPGQIDGYAVPAALFTVAPNGMVRRSYIRKDDGVAHTFQNGIRSAGVNGLGVAAAVASGYGWIDGGTCYVNDPATGAPWTAAAADAASMIIDETS